MLRNNKKLFVSKQAYHSFNGYAYAQFKRMTHFNQEAQSDMSLLEGELAGRGIDLENLKVTQEERNSLVDNGPFEGQQVGALIDQYAGLKRKYFSGGYMGAKRKELVRRVGYDAKNAAHLIRLLRMGIEFLVEGALHVERADAEQLLSIKRGEWSIERVTDEAERLFKLAEEAYVRSSLPAEPDMQKAEKLCVSIVAHFHGLSTESNIATL